MILGVNEKPTVRPYAYLAYVEAILENKTLFRGRIPGAEEREWNSISYDTDVTWDGDCVNVINHDTYDGNNNTETFIYTSCRKDDELVIKMEQFVNIRENAIVNLFVCPKLTDCSISDTLMKGYRLGVTRYGLYIKHREELISMDAANFEGYVGVWNKPKWFRVKVLEDKLTTDISLDGDNWFQIDEMEKAPLEQFDLIGINTNFLGIGEQYYNWLYTNFVQLIFDKEEISQVLLNYYNAPYIGMVNEQPLAPMFLETSKDNLDDIVFLFNSVNDYLTFYLMRGYYVVISIDVYYVPGHGKFANEHYHHPVLVYGFDEDTRDFIILDYDMQLFSARIPYDVFAQEGFYQKDYSIMRYRYISNIFVPKYEFNVKAFKNNLDSFLTGNGANERFAFMLPGLPGAYGIDIWNEILDDPKGMTIYTEDRRLSYIMFEHASLMKQRISFLKDRGYLKKEDSKEIFEICDELIRDTEALKNAVIWVKMSRKSEGREEQIAAKLTRIREFLSTICDLEVKLFKELSGKVEV